MAELLADADGPLVPPFQNDGTTRNFFVDNGAVITPDQHLPPPRTPADSRVSLRMKRRRMPASAAGTATCRTVMATPPASAIDNEPAERDTLRHPAPHILRINPSSIKKQYKLRTSSVQQPFRKLDFPYCGTALPSLIATEAKHKDLFLSYEKAYDRS